MIRLSKSVFNDLAIFMMGFGFLVGIVFPFFLILLGVPASITLQPWFIFVCIMAGLVVGLVNIILARSVVGARLQKLVKRMQYISNHLINDSHEDIVSNCKTSDCLLEVDSSDVLGESAKSYNVLVNSLFASLKSELMVRQFTSMLSTRLELEDLGVTVLPALLSFTGTEAGTIVMERDGEMEVIASYRIRDNAGVVKSDVVTRAIVSKQRQLLQMPADIAIESSVLDFSPRTVLVEPLVYHDVALGVIVLASVSAISQETLAMLELVNASLAVAFRNALTYDQLQKLAANDSLTGMFNRRFGMARLQEEFGRSIRSGSPVGVCIFDLDHFKNVNDTYGHPMGDKVLVHVSRLLKSALREGDVALRYGGEEFMAVLPGASLTDAFQIADRVRRLVEETVFQHGSQNLKLTLSGGAASWPDFDASSSDALVRRADEALYQAKEGGRNRIVAL